MKDKLAVSKLQLVILCSCLCSYTTGKAPSESPRTEGIVAAGRSSCLKRVAFSSTNFENILTWETEADTPPGTAFDVQYKQYGEKSWLPKAECQGTGQRSCNLTRETENFTEHFYARVRAAGRPGCSSGWVRSERFEPRKETVIGAPQVEFIPYVRSIKFLIRPPYTPLRGEDDRQLTVEDIYSKFGAVDYHLTIFNQRTRQQWTKSEQNKEFEVSNLDPDTEYNGTVYMYLLQRSSKSQVFWVKTLEDKTWVLYSLVALGFCAGLVFAATACMIYKYVKQHSAQPMALDFRGISSFQPLTLTVEHIIKPISLSKPSLFIPEVPLPQIGQQLDRALEPPRPSRPPESVCHQQAEVPAFQLPPQPSCVEVTAPTGYAPQKAEQSVPTSTADKPLPVTYGVCVEGTDHAYENLRPHQTLQEASPGRVVGGELPIPELGKSSLWNYKEQQPSVALWGGSRDRTGTVPFQGSPGKTQLLMLLQRDRGENPEYLRPPLSLSLLKQGGCYRQQAAGLSLPARSAGTDCSAEQELSASLLSSVRTGNDSPAEDSAEQWMLPDPFPHRPANKAQLPETPEMFPAGKWLSCSRTGPGSALTTFFEDLELKLQGDEDGNT
ncbi:interleukin-22 receptor subunit alpha-1 [Empidonax traillii]|uniref:interleukin-22 receptor subunit alpha-1 n=1 Tax=Empidonax traillii TaxID=164674 RepID=UPI000FFDBF26|nr:interleukin-22 receptor subunit alpha-1 [Empidonax traillii]